MQYVNSLLVATYTLHKTVRHVCILYGREHVYDHTDFPTGTALTPCSDVGDSAATPVEAKPGGQMAIRFVSTPLNSKAEKLNGRRVCPPTPVEAKPDDQMAMRFCLPTPWGLSVGVMPVSGRRGTTQI
jgi:hypothetical protein